MPNITIRLAIIIITHSESVGTACIEPLLGLVVLVDPNVKLSKADRPTVPEKTTDLPTPVKGTDNSDQLQNWPFGSPMQLFPVLCAAPEAVPTTPLNH